MNIKKSIISHKKEYKTCPSCSRIFYNRKKWGQRGIWKDVIYCSNGCKKNKKPKN